VGNGASARVQQILDAIAHADAVADIVPAGAGHSWPSPLDAIVVAVDEMVDWMKCCHVAGTRHAPIIVATDFLAPDRRYRDLAFAAGAAAYVCGSASPEDWRELLARVGSGERGIEILRGGCAPSSAVQP
jgi:hypothetical protein